jgi:hypothetical protein
MVRSSPFDRPNTDQFTARGPSIAIAPQQIGP